MLPIEFMRKFCKYLQIKARFFHGAMEDMVNWVISQLKIRKFLAWLNLWPKRKLYMLHVAVLPLLPSRVTMILHTKSVIITLCIIKTLCILCFSLDRSIFSVSENLKILNKFGKPLCYSFFIVIIVQFGNLCRIGIHTHCLCQEY